MKVLLVAHEHPCAINTSCHRIRRDYISKSYFSAALDPLLCFPLIAYQRRAKGKTETVQVSKFQALVSCSLPTQHISLLCTCAPLGPIDKYICMHEHTGSVHKHVHMHKCRQASHLFSLLNNSELPFPFLHNRRSCQNVPVTALLLHSVQYCRHLDSFSSHAVLFTGSCLLGFLPSCQECFYLARATTYLMLCLPFHTSRKLSIYYH